MPVAMASVCASPLDVDKEVKQRAAAALNAAERARLERIVARTMSSFGVPASDAVKHDRRRTIGKPEVPTQHQPKRQNRER